MLNVSWDAPFPSIPADISRLIIELAAESDRSEGLRLAYVSPETQEWVDPIIYRDVLLRDTMQIRRFNRTLKLKPRSFFELRVRRLLFSIPTSIREGDIDCVVSILSTCTGVTTVFVYPMTFLGSAGRALGHSLHLRRLACPLDFLSSTSGLLFQSLSHLEIFLRSPEECMMEWDYLSLLSQFPSLTHLSLHSVSRKRPLPEMRAMRTILPACPSLIRVLVLNFDYLVHLPLAQDMEVWMQNGGDPRVVLEGIPLRGDSAYVENGIFYRSWDRYLHDWLHSSAGEKDGWDFAEEIVAARGPSIIRNGIDPV